MNFKLKIITRYEGAGFSEYVDMVADVADDEVAFVGNIKDFAIAAEICRRWNEYGQK